MFLTSVSSVECEDKLIRGGCIFDCRELLDGVQTMFEFGARGLCDRDRIFYMTWSAESVGPPGHCFYERSFRTFDFRFLGGLFIAAAILREVASATARTGSASR